jgi:3-hydroxymyristoyl/3-hydroxydecanoyl-(acyl carrier protein) dehydratase
MRWRFVDRVTSFEPWKRMIARKAISLEEYSLLKPFGRKGTFPESLMLESCVESVRWLVAASSGFTQVCILCEVSDFQFEREVGMGHVLEIAATVKQRAENDLNVACGVNCLGENVAHGEIGVVLAPLSESFDREIIETMWRELYGAS